MAFRKRNPGDPCCTDCDWIDEDFTGDMSGWTIPGGDTWTVNDPGDYAYSSDEPSILLSTTTYPYNADSSRHAGYRGGVNPYHQHSVVASFMATATDQVILLIVTAADTSNYIALEITFKTLTTTVAGSFRLIDVTAGSVTAISETFTEKRLIPNSQIYAAVDFDDGDVRASISDTRLQFQLSEINEENTSWVRVIRSEDQGPYAGDEVTYHGTYVGFGITTSGSSNVRVYEFEAGCHGVREYCEYDRDNIPVDASSWKYADYTKLSGTWPTRSGSSLVVSSGASTKLQHVNRLPTRYLNQQKYAATMTVDCEIGTTASIWFACNSGFTTGYEGRATVEDAGGGNVQIKHELIRISGSVVLDSVTGGAFAAGTNTTLISWDGRFSNDSVAWGDLEDLTEADPDDTYCGFSASPVSADLTISSASIDRLGAINDHWPTYAANCPSEIYTACSDWCVNDEWPAEVLIEIEGVFESKDPPTSPVSTGGCGNLTCEDYNLDAYLSQAGAACGNGGLSSLCVGHVPPYWPAISGLIAGHLYVRVALSVVGTELKISANSYLYATDGVGGIGWIQTSKFQSAALSTWDPADEDNQTPIDCTAFDRVPLSVVPYGDDGLFCEVNANGKMYVTSV